MSKSKISAFIITKNEEVRISRAIKSVKNIVDEIIVVDSESSDNTVEIARNLGARVVTRPWCGYVAQKTFAESLCINDWVLNIDADEELSKELQQEISDIFSSGKQIDYLAYGFKLIIIHRNNPVPLKLAPSNQYVRLYNKNYASFGNTIDSTTHDLVRFNPGVTSRDKIFFLKKIAYHYSGISITQLIEKANFYSSQQVDDLFKQGRRPSNIRIFFEMIVCFFKIYLVRRYFVFGFDGFIDSVIFAFIRFLRLAKLREKVKNNE